MQGATRMEMVHLKAIWSIGDAVCHEYLRWVLALAPLTPYIRVTIRLHSAQLGVSWTARLHVRRVDRAIVAMKTARSSSRMVTVIG